MSEKIGRNDFCPCGSGKKYKKCCFGKEEVERESQSAQKERTAAVAVDSLRRKIVGFMERKEFLPYLKPALQLYWKTLEEGLEPPPMGDTEILAFNEWYIHDCILPDYGKPLITVFLESSPELTKEELQILKDWQETNLSVYQITKVEEGHGIFVEDIFTGEESFLNDVTCSRSIKQWELLITRKVWVLNEWQLSAAGIRLFPMDKEEINSLVMTHYRKYKKEHTTATIPDFLHVKGYILNHYYQTRKAKPVRLPTVVTAEGEEVVFHEALFDVVDFKKVVRKLEATIDFQIRSEKENEKGELVHCTFDWLQRGKSSELFKEKQASKGISFHSFYTQGPGQESYRVLGNIDVYPDRLKLSVISKKRLRVGTDLLKKTFKATIKHRIDTIQTLESKMKTEKGKSVAEKQKIDPEIENKLLKEMFDRHYQNWLDSRIPALGDNTPRESVRTKQGRKKVEDLLRMMEHMEQRKEEHGQFCYDFSWIRKELGILN